MEAVMDSDLKKDVFESIWKHTPELETRHVWDVDLEKTIHEVIHRLLGSVEDAFKVFVGTFEDIPFLGRVVIYNPTSMILVSTRAKEMFGNKGEEEILYATIAHEIGHIKDMESTDFYLEDTIEFFTKKEIEADRIALELLGRIYDEPKRVLLRQIESPFKANFDFDDRIGYHTDESLLQAKVFYNARKNALTCSGVDSESRHVLNPAGRG